MKKLLLFITLLLQANTIVGEGETKKEALSDLSNQLSVNIKSEFKSYVKIIGNNYKKAKEKKIYLISNLPLKGVKYQNSNPIKAILSSKSLKVYKSELSRLKKEINYLKTQPKTYDNLTLLLQNIESFNKNKIVAVALGATDLPKITITKAEAETELTKITKKIKSLQTASKIVTKNINKKNVYISIRPYGSNEVTQLASILKDSISQYLQTTKYSDKADYFLRGNYKILKDSIFVTFNLMDNDNNILKTITLNLDKQAYKNLYYKPHTQSFDMSLINGFVKNGKLSVNVGFKGYNREDGIELKSGEKIDIVVKTNKPICYFLVGYVLHKNKQFAYLIPINGDGFVNNITGNDVNKNITIIEDIEISPPFGREALQIVASTFKNGKCPIIPPKCKNNNDGYCVIDNKPKKALVMTRGLLKKTKKTEKTEATISWTSS